MGRTSVDGDDGFECWNQILNTLLKARYKHMCSFDQLRNVIREGSLRIEESTMRLLSNFCFYNYFTL